MFFLLSFLERFARLLPQGLRVEIAAFIADRLLRALDTSTIPLPRIARAHLRLQRLLAAFAVARWREVCGFRDSRIPALRGGQLVRSRAGLRQGLIETRLAFQDIDSLVAAMMVIGRARRWLRFTRAPRRLTARLIARVRAVFAASSMRCNPAPVRALDPSG